MDPDRHASRLALVGLVLVLAVSLPHAREITFEERVDAQAAIERVHHAHQIGRAVPFEEAVPRSVLDEKVRRYLGESVALEEIDEADAEGSASPDHPSDAWTSA